MRHPRTPLELTSRLVSAYVAHNPVPPKDIETLLRAVHQAFASLTAGEPEHVPAVAARASVTPDYIVCLEDGKRLKMLKRYLRSHFGMSPEDYRAKWKLRSDYPMTAPNYAARRSSIAKSSGLGRARPRNSPRRKRGR